MNWQAEADALIEDIRGYVSKIDVSSSHESSKHRIYLHIETLEGVEMLVSMDASGFVIRESDRVQTGSKENDGQAMRVYETINSLLDDTSPKYREAFASDLKRKILSLEGKMNAKDDET